MNEVNKHIVKARNAGPAIVREAEIDAADLILMANTPVRVRGNIQQIHPAVDYVIKNAPCEVLVLSQGYVDANLNGGAEAGITERKAEKTGTAV